MADKYRSSSARNLQAGKGSAHLRNTHICCGSTDGDAAGGRLGEPRDGAQQRRLAGAAAAEHEAQAVGGQLQADVVQDRRLRASGMPNGTASKRRLDMKASVVRAISRVTMKYTLEL